MFSHKVWVRPLRRKNSKDVAVAFDDIFKESGTTPERIQTDNGGEFMGEVSSLFESLDIKQSFGLSHSSVTFQGQIERFFRTMKSAIQQWIMESGRRSYLKDFLPDWLRNYNSTRHSSTRVAPIQASKANSILKQLLVKRRTESVSRSIDRASQASDEVNFKPGNRVRLLLSSVPGLAGSRIRADRWRKGHKQNWTKEIYTVQRQIRQTRVSRHRIVLNEFPTKTFFPSELQLVRTIIKPLTVAKKVEEKQQADVDEKQEEELEQLSAFKNVAQGDQSSRRSKRKTTETEKAKVSTQTSRKKPATRSNVAKPPETFEVDRIVKVRLRKVKGRKRWEALVRWKGFSSADDSWEPFKHLNKESRREADALKESL